MSLHLEYPYYTSGQMVRGFIRLRTVESLSTKVLYLRLEGPRHHKFRLGTLSVVRREQSKSTKTARSESILQP